VPPQAKAIPVQAPSSLRCYQGPEVRPVPPQAKAIPVQAPPSPLQLLLQLRCLLGLLL
jgi:hypothetical protein